MLQGEAELFYISPQRTQKQWDCCTQEKSSQWPCPGLFPDGPLAWLNFLTFLLLHAGACLGCCVLKAAAATVSVIPEAMFLYCILYHLLRNKEFAVCFTYIYKNFVYKKINIEADGSFLIDRFLGSLLGEWRWKVQGRKHQLCSFNFKTLETQQISLTSQRAVPGGRSRARKQFWRGFLVSENSKGTKSCTRGMLMGPAFAAPQQQAPAEGLRSRWRLLSACGTLSQNGVATEPYSPPHLQEEITSHMNFRYIPQVSCLPQQGYNWSFVYVPGKKSCSIKKCLIKKQQLLSFFCT